MGGWGGGVIYLPESCPRGLTTCEPLAQLMADDPPGSSFVCCGLNDGSGRQVPEDRFTVCFKNEAIDERGDWSERDIKDHLSVLAQALSADVNMRGET